MKIIIVSSGVFGEADYPEVDFEFFVETELYKTYYEFIDAGVLVDDLRKFAEGLKKFPFESKLPVTFDATHLLSNLEKIHKKRPDGLVLQVSLKDAAGAVCLSVQTEDERSGVHIAFEDDVDTASLHRLSRGLLTTDFKEKVTYTWDSTHID